METDEGRRFALLLNVDVQVRAKDTAAAKALAESITERLEEAAQDGVAVVHAFVEASLYQAKDNGDTTGRVLWSR